MNGRYISLGMPTAWRRFEIESGTQHQSKFEKRLREAEAGIDALNLSADSVHLAAEIAAIESHLDDERRIALIRLILVSLAALQEGNTRFPVTGSSAREPLRRILAPICGEEELEGAADAIENLLESGDASGVIARDPAEYKPILYLKPFIYHQRVWAAETALAKRLAALAASKIEDAIDESAIRAALSAILTERADSDQNGVSLSDEQQRAIVTALLSPLTVISGGPGTGKTTIIFTLLRVLTRLGVAPDKVAIAAPTGKAAFRIGESIREGMAALLDIGERTLVGEYTEARTIHRMLGYSPGLGRFRYHRNNPLAASILIIDEASMIDLSLMERLADAVRDGSRLILLGDASQLPSVAAGAVLRDLLPDAAGDNSASISTDSSIAWVRLGRNYRTVSEDPAGRAISLLTTRINDGTYANSLSDGTPVVQPRQSPDDLAFAGAEFLSTDAASIESFLERWYRERIRGNDDLCELAQRIYTAGENGFESSERDGLQRLFDHVNGCRILCVTRVLDTGADRINARLHRRAVERSEAGSRERFIAGEPVVVIRNDYERMLFNGDQGLIVRVRTGDSKAALMAVFPRGDNFRAFRLDLLKDDLELGYAMTVHKAQGSEFDFATLILPVKDLPILTRELVYTAVSRARRSIILVGMEEILRAGVMHKIQRYSGLREQLAKARSAP